MGACGRGGRVVGWVLRSEVAGVAIGRRDVRFDGVRQFCRMRSWVHAMAYSRYIGFERAVILLFATVACALLTMVVGIGMIHLRLPPTDGAYGKPWFSIEVMTVAGPLCILCAAIAYPVMIWGLVRTKLAKSLPVVFVVSTGSMAASAGLGPLGAGISLACSTVAIAWCRWRLRDSVGAAPNTTQQPTGAPSGAGG